MLFNPRYPDLDTNVPCVPCSDEDFWGDMTEDEWEGFYNDRYMEGFGGD